MKIGNFGEIPTVNISVSQPKPKREVVVAQPATQFLDFEKDKVQTLTLAQLEMTNKENRGDDRSCPHGIYHYVLIEKLLEMCAQHGYNAEVYDLFATNNRDKQTPGVSLYPNLEKKYGTRAVQAHTLRRVFANVRLTNFDDDELTTNLAVSYTQKGIQVGFGSMVKVCRNQNMMGRGQFVADYTISNHYASGNEYKTDLEGIFAKVNGWLTDAEHIVIRDRETIERMKRSILTSEQIFIIIGALTSLRAMCDSTNKSIHYSGVYPLNQTQISKFTEDLLIKQKKCGQITAWQLYNVATNLYKPQTCEQNLILPQNQAMVSFMQQYEIF